MFCEVYDTDKTGVFTDNGHQQIRIRDLLFFARGVPTNQ